MAILELLFFHFFIFPITYASEDCQFARCSNNRIIIRFPFQLQGEQNPYCGYPGFNLICTNDSKTVLKLPYSGEFHVRNINYATQHIQLYDPDNYLPKRLLSLNFSGTPFAAIFRRNYTFLSCPSQNAGSQFTAIDCLSSSANFVSAVPSAMLDDSLPEPCYVINRTSVPVARLGGQYEETFRDDLSEDLWLTWYKPDCRNCESQEGMCGFESRNSYQIHCFSDSKTGNSQDGLRVFRIITLSIAGPAVICVTIVACLACFMDSRRGTSAPSRSTTATAAISPQPPMAAATMGLDESTIESYQKVVLGESRRLPGPNDGTCSICLSEYNSKETIRCIPDCTHCFHADCIDEWLRLNSSCPVCRSSPSPSPLHLMSNNT